MLDLVFPTDNGISTRTVWSKTAGGGIQGATRSRDLGICAAMTAYWIKRCIDRGVGSITSSSQIGLPHQLGILQSAKKYNAKGSWQWVLDAVGLSSTNTEVGSDCVASLLSTELTRKNGFYFIAISREGHGGHALGAHIAANSFYFFDANVGLFHGTRRIDFITHVGHQLDSRYGEILDYWGRCEVS